MECQNDSRIERLKQVLASSYPRVDEEEKPAPLPQSVLERLHPKVEPPESILTRFVNFVARPVPALGAVAIVTISAFLVFRPDPTLPPQGPGIRSGGETALTPRLVLVNAPRDSVDRFQASGYFPEDLLSVSTYGALGRKPAIVLDWRTRTITRYVSGGEPVSEPFEGDDDEVLERVLELYQEMLSE